MFRHQKPFQLSIFQFYLFFGIWFEAALFTCCRSCSINAVNLVDRTWLLNLFNHLFCFNTLQRPPRRGGGRVVIEHKLRGESLLDQRDTVKFNYLLKLQSTRGRRHTLWPRDFRRRRTSALIENLRERSDIPDGIVGASPAGPHRLGSQQVQQFLEDQSRVYPEGLEMVVKPWTDGISAGLHYVFQKTVGGMLTTYRLPMVPTVPMVDHPELYSRRYGPFADQTLAPWTM